MRRYTTTDDGWLVDRDLHPAGEAARIPALAELAELVRRGVVSPTAPCVVARRRTEAPYPDVVVAVPLPPAVAVDWLEGRKAAAADVAAMLEQGYRALMDAARRGEEV